MYLGLDLTKTAGAYLISVNCPSEHEQRQAAYEATMASKRDLPAGAYLIRAGCPSEHEQRQAAYEATMAHERQF